MTTQKKELVAQEIPIQSTSPVEMISKAVAGGVTPDQLEKLLQIQLQYEANEARKAYHRAMADFKQNPPKIIKDKKNTQYKSMYTTLGNLINTVNPELSKNGLSASWDIEQNGIIKVTCRMTHKMGHSESSSAQAPADTSGSKNVIQQIKSTITYLKSVTFEAVTGLASTDANLDDDGNGIVEFVDEGQLNQLHDLIYDRGVDEGKFLLFMGVESLEKIKKSDFKKASTALLQKKKK